MLKVIIHLSSGAVMLLMGLVSVIFCLFSLFVLVGALNPLQTATAFSVRVVNRSGQNLQITPVGTLGRGWGKGMETKHVLTQFLFEWPALPSLNVKDLPVSNGAERIITYDAELPFTHLVVHDPAGNFAQIEVARFEGSRWVMNNSNSLIVLKSSDLKVPPDPNILAAVTAQSRRDWTVVLAGIPPVLLACSLAGFAFIIRAVRLQDGI